MVAVAVAVLVAVAVAVRVAVAVAVAVGVAVLVAVAVGTLKWIVPVAGLPDRVVAYRVLSSTDTVPESSFATIRSGLPSPLMSAAVTESGSLPVAKVCWVAKVGVVAPGAVVLSSTDTVSAARHSRRSGRACRRR